MTTILDYRPRRLIDFWKHDGPSVYCGTMKGTYVLDQISAFIWERCDGQHTIARIIEELVQATGMDGREDIVKADVERLLVAWKDERFVILNFNSLHAGSEYDEESIYAVDELEPAVDILLVVPPSPNPMTWANLKVHSTFPLGIGTLSAVLQEQNYRVAMANLWIRSMNPRSLTNLMEKAHPKVLGISSMTDNFPNGMTIARIARQVLPEVKIICGGPHVTFTDIESMQRHPEIDVVVRSEGEFALLELMDYYIYGYGNLERIQGITYRKGSDIYQNRSRPLIQNLDELPLPNRKQFAPVDGLLGLQTSRGCAERCIFCVASSMSGGQVRTRSPEHVMDEVLHLYRLGMRHFFFQDDTLTTNVDRLRVILEILERFDLNLEWSAESRVDVIDKDPLIFERMSRAGCIAVQFGVEASSQDVLDQLHKNIHVDQISRAIYAGREAGLKVICTMLMGHPFDTPNTIQHSVSYATKLIDQGAEVLFSIVIPFPGTALERTAGELGLKVYPVDYSDYFVANAIMDTPRMTRREIRAHYFDAMRTLIIHNSKSKGKFTLEKA